MESIRFHGAHEMSDVLDESIRTERAVIHAATALSNVTAGWVLVSRGPRGALLVGEGQTLTRRAPSVRVRNTIGAGDALVAAVAMQIQKQSSPEDWLRWGVAAGTAATEHVAGKLAPTRRIRQLSFGPR